MIRQLLATTAIAALMTTGALAQTQPAQTDKMAEPAQTETMPADQANPRIFSERKPGDAGAYFEATQGQVLASSLIGESVFSGTNDDAETVGDVNDVVLSPDGQAQAVIIGVGGFLGIGEKDVAINFSELSWVERDGSNWLVIATTKDALEQAPAFDRTVLLPKQPAENVAVVPADPSMQADPAASNDNMAAAPAAKTEMPADKDQTAMAPADDAAAPAAEEKMAADENAEKPAEEQTAMDAEPKEDAAAMPSNETTAAVPPASTDNMTAMMAGDLSADELIGTTVYGANDETLGEIGDVIVSADGSGVEAFIVDVGGFLGVGEKPIALDASSLQIMKDENGALYVYTPFTEDQLKEQAAYAPDEYKANRDGIILR